ncbi:MAG: DUF3160 domain-containing protein [Candidatus Neomarinimicrobiota bacterium]
MDFTVSPVGLIVAIVNEINDAKNVLKFWRIGEKEICDSFILPCGLKVTNLVWHPRANALFIMGKQDTAYKIIRVDKKNKEWNITVIFSSKNELKKLVICPRPFVTNYDYNIRKTYYSYRLFFGMDNGDGTFRIVSVTETGKRFYQVVGPARTFSSDEYEEAPPSQMKARWALPVAFHPAGNELIWETDKKKYYIAEYDWKFWGNSKPASFIIDNLGSIIPTSNGLGLLHWCKDKPGLGLYLLATNDEKIQLPEYRFITAPVPTPDGKGVVGVTWLQNRSTLNYIPIDVPLAGVMNAWMYNRTSDELEHFKKHMGLFRPNNADQMYTLYESENYYCNDYSPNVPTRPYLVTTDIFWELFGAAYEGLFIIKERDEAIPNFWKFIDEASKHLKNSDKESKWLPVFSTLQDLYADNMNNPEVVRIQNEQDDYSEIIKGIISFSDLKPRGHYTSTSEMQKYFKAFKYFTMIYKPDIYANSDATQDEYLEALNELNFLPEKVQAYAVQWINCYRGFISPSRYPLVWKSLRNEVSKYCQFPPKEMTIFPLAWGFDNEALYSTVYHTNFPPELQIINGQMIRVLPSGLDLAAAMGNGLADHLLESDYVQFPPLRRVINNLRANHRMNASEKDDNLYNQWLNALAVQWADTVECPNGLSDREIWQVKRLQTGLASWATLRHATILVNETTAAECGEAGFEEILMQAPRGYVEPDPYTLNVIEDLFETAVKYVAGISKERSDNTAGKSESNSLYDGIINRLKESAQEIHAFQSIAEKEKRGEILTNEEYEKILYVARTAEHLFLIFSSLANAEYGLIDPDPIAKVADVAKGDGTERLLVAVGNTMEWDHIVPYYGRSQIVKGAIYSYYEFHSDKILNDEEWRTKTESQEILPWIKPFITYISSAGAAKTGY